MRIKSDSHIVISGFNSVGVLLDVGYDDPAQVIENKGDTFLVYGGKNYLFEKDSLVLLEGEIEKKRIRTAKAGKLPKSDPDLVEYLTEPDPSKHINDITNVDDIDTLKVVYLNTTWQYKYAVNFWALCHKYNSLTVPQWMKKSLVLQQWADEFDKIVRTKKGNEEQVRRVMLWLTRIDDFWFSTGNLASPKKFHKKNRDGLFYFEFFLNKTRIAAPNYPIKGMKYTINDIELMCLWYKLEQKQFKKNTSTTYLYVGEKNVTT